MFHDPDQAGWNDDWTLPPFDSPLALSGAPAWAASTPIPGAHRPDHLAAGAFAAPASPFQSPAAMPISPGVADWPFDARLGSPSGDLPAPAWPLTLAPSPTLSAVPMQRDPLRLTVQVNAPLMNVPMVSRTAGQGVYDWRHANPELTMRMPRCPPRRGPG